MEKRFLLLLLLFVSGSIFIVNVRGMLQSYYGFYYTKEAVQHNKIYNSLSFVEDLRPYSIFLTYTGLETGYGFFAPNVASDFVIEISCADSSGKINDNVASLVKTKEGFLRMNTASSMFMCYTMPDSTGLEEQKCKLFLKGICMRILEQQQHISAVTVRVYLYHHPFLQDYRTNPHLKPSYILYATEHYQRNSIGAW